MKMRHAVWRSISTMSRGVSHDLASLQSRKWYSTALSPPDSRIPFAEWSDRGSTREVTLYAICASFLGIAMAGMTILWLAKLGEILSIWQFG